MFIADPESWIRMFPIPDPRYWIQIFSILDPGSQILIFSIPGPGSQMHIKEFKYFNQKNGFSALRNMIQVFHPGSGSRIWILTFYLSQIPILGPRSQIQGSKRKRIPDPWSRIRIRNTGDFGFAQAVEGRVSYWLSMGAAVLKGPKHDQIECGFFHINPTSMGWWLGNKAQKNIWIVLSLVLPFNTRDFCLSAVGYSA